MVTDDPIANSTSSNSSEDGSGESEAAANFTHDPNATDCAQCHTADFRQDKHLKVEEPKLYYTLSELRNCAGSCHLYEDDTFTTIKENRSNKHSIYKDGW